MNIYIYIYVYIYIYIYIYCQVAQDDLTQTQILFRPVDMVAAVRGEQTQCSILLY